MSNVVELVQLAVRCRNAAGGKECRSPLMKLHVNGTASIRITCPACRQESTVEWTPLGIRVEADRPLPPSQ